MQSSDDGELLRQYAESGSEEAFSTLVARHINLVYSVALRHVGDAHRAEEITQAVFVILAKKAGTLREVNVLGGWLFQVARLTAINFVRSEARRHRREQEAHMQSVLNEPDRETWQSIAPLLDAAVAGLGEKDRHAILLRFYEGRNLREVGLALGGTEGAAEKRVGRALEKLRKFFAKRGVASSTAAIAGVIAANSVHAAPALLTKSVTTAAIAKGAAAGSSITTLVKGALQVMAWTKAKTAVAVGVGVLLATGTATVTVKEIKEYQEEHRTYPWQVPGFSSSRLDQAPPQVAILNSKVSEGGGWGYAENKMMGTHASASIIIQAAYSGPRNPSTPARMILSTELPTGHYDFIGSLPSGSAEALQQEIKKKFGVVAHHETRETAVLLFKVHHAGGKGLKRTPGQRDESQNSTSAGSYSCRNTPISNLAYFLEESFEVPVLDRTGLEGRFDIDLRWSGEQDWQNRNLDALKRVLLDELGLELVPAREPVEMLIVEKAK